MSTTTMQGASAMDGNGTLHKNMIVQENSFAKIKARLEEVTDKGQKLAPDDLNARRQLLDAARTLCTELESPMEAVFRTVIIQPILYMCIRVAIDLDLFTVMAKEESHPRSSTHLGEMLGVDLQLLGRFLKNMAAMDFLTETGPDAYDLTPVSKSLLSPSHRDGFPFCHDVLLPSFSSAPQFFKETRYSNPSEIKNTLFQLGLSTKLTFFEYLGTHPDQNKYFNNFMGMYAQDRPRWLDPGHFPVREILGEGASTDKDAVLLVDVGGGKGHDLVLFQKLYHDLPGRLVLQDLPYVIQQAGALPAGIEATPHDFFQPQPIQGARAYYFHSVLHGWPDAKCLDILRTIVPAMKKGYSKLLINEIVIPNEHAHRLSTSMDLLMMTVVAAEERTEKNWDRLLKEVGLKVVKLWTFEIGTEAVIEAELA